MKKAVLALSMCLFLAAAAYAGKLALKFNLGGTYLMGGDYNKGIEGFRDYELSALGAGETFVDEMKKLGLGYQLGAELLYQLNPNLAIGLEVGYLSASVTSHLERTWHSYKWTINPTLSAVPVTLNLDYFKKLGDKLKLHAMAGAGAFLANLNYKYNIEATVAPYHGTWTPDAKAVIGAKAGVGLEYLLADKLSLTLDLIGRYAEIEGFTGAYEGINTSGLPYSGTCQLYFYNYDGVYPMVGLYEATPSGAHIHDAREAVFSLSGVSLQIGVKIDL